MQLTFRELTVQGEASTRETIKTANALEENMTLGATIEKPDKRRVNAKRGNSLLRVKDVCSVIHADTHSH